MYITIYERILLKTGFFYLCLCLYITDNCISFLKILFILLNKI